MSRLIKIFRTLVALWTGILLALALVAGCGEKPAQSKKEAPEKSAAEKRREDQLTQQRQRELELMKKLEDVKMPEELAKEWFWDGDGTYDLTAEWLLSSGRLRFHVKPETQKGKRRAKQEEELKLVIGFYGSDTARGPYAYLGRVEGAQLVLPQPLSLNEVQGRYYKAVIFDDAGKPIHYTTPVRAGIDEHRVQSTVAPPKKAVRKKSAGTKAPPKAVEVPEKKEAAPETPKKPVVAVVLLYNAAPDDDLERQYIGRGLCELLRGFCAELAGIETPDSGYVDLVLQRQKRGRHSELTPATLARVGASLGADTVVTGTFEVGEKEFKVELAFVNAATGAVLRSQSVKAPEEASDDMGESLATELAQGLGQTLDAGSKAKFSLMWKKLNERRRYIEKALRLVEDGKHVEATAAFEAVRPGEVRDGEVLAAVADAYIQAGNLLQGARLLALASHAPEWTPPRDYLDNLGRVLRNARSLKESLNVLASVRADNPVDVWKEAMRLLDHSLAGRTIRQAWKGPKKSWPVAPAAWQVTTDALLVNPRLGDGSLVVFESTDPEVVKTLLDPSQLGARNAAVKTTFAAPELYDTAVYDLATGALRWQKGKLLSAVSVPAIADGTLFGMGPRGPAAVSLKTGAVVWEDKSGRIRVPDTIQATNIDYGRAWWLTFELRRTPEHLVVWHPGENVVYSYDAKTGAPCGEGYHNDTWGMAGQYFLETPEGLHFLQRGGATLVTLTDQQLANPTDLTPKLRMIPDPAAVLCDDTLFEVTRRISTSDVKRFDFFVVGSDVKKGEFKWVYPLLSERMPVIAGGKIFIYRKSITGTTSARVQMIDVDKKDTRTIDISALELSLYEPTIALPGGKNVLIGSQGAIAAADGKVVWANRALPVTRTPRLVGKYLLVPPMVVDPETGNVVMELQVPPGFNWDRVEVAGDDDYLLLLRSYVLKRRRESKLEGNILAYRMRAPEAPVEAAPKADEGAAAGEAAAEPAAPRVEDVEQVFLDSDLSPPLDEHMYDLFERIATARYETSGEANDAVEYLTNVLKTRPQNGMHLNHVAALLKPYASMAGKYDQFVSLLGEIKTAYKADEEAVAALVQQEEEAQKDKAEADRAVKYFETIKTAQHDPLMDWPSEYPASGAGNRGAGVAPPFDVGWTWPIPRTTPFDRVIPADPATFVFQKRNRLLIALNPADGRKLWELPGVTNFVYYHGVAYALLDELRALTPREGLVLWKKQLDEGATARDVAMAAGEDRVFLAMEDGIQAFDWATGRELFRLDLPGKDRIDVHGSTLIAVTGNTGKLHAVEAKTGNRRWTGTVGTYSLFDGKLYSFEFNRDAKKLELILICYQAATGREMWRRHYDLPPGKRTPDLVPAAVSWENIVVVCDVNLLHLARANGEIVAKQTLPSFVTSPLAATPNLVYVNGADKKLVAYDLTNNLSQVWELPTTGQGAMAIGHGTLYILDKNELRAFRGQKENYSAEHLKALAEPSEDTGAEANAPKDTTIEESRFVSIGVIEGKQSLAAKMDDKRLGSIAFQQLVNLGDVGDWKLMIEELTKRLAPGERKTRVLTEAETRMLFAEIVQRRDPAGQRVAKDMLESGNRRLVSVVLELMTTGDRSVYGPLLVRVFREALDNKQYMTATYCAEAVGTWRHEGGLSLLTNGLGDEKAPDGLRFACAKALAAFDNTQAIAALLKVAREKSTSSLPRQCTQLLAGKGPEGVKAVGGLLASASAEELVRLNAAQALAEANSPEAAPFLLAALEAKGGSYPPKVRAAAAAALGPLSKDNEDIFKALLANMKDRTADPYLRNACMNGLGMSDNPMAIPHLIEAMGERDIDNRQFTKTSAHQFLRRLSGESRIGQYQEEWQRWWQQNKDRFEKKP